MTCRRDTFWRVFYPVVQLLCGRGQLTIRGVLEHRDQLADLHQPVFFGQWSSSDDRVTLHATLYKAGQYT